MKKFLLIVCAMLALNVATAQKNVLLEEATGTWCQYCPEGIYYIDSLCEAYDNVIAIAIHTNDVMANEVYFAATGLTQAPSANIGRNFSSKTPSEWFSCVQQDMALQPKSTVTVENQFDETTRTLTSVVTITALEDISGNNKIFGLVYEDAVTGPAPQYNQANQYANSYYQMGGFQNLPNPVPANRMAFDHVARQLLSSYSGDTGMPSFLAAGESYSHTFTYVIPEEYNPEYIRVVGAMIAEAGNIDNVAKSSYLNGKQNAAPKFTSTPVTEGFAFVNYIYNIYVHDTDDKNLAISIEEKPEWLTYEQYDSKSAALYGTTETPGEYEVVIKVTDGEDETVQSFTIEISEPLDGAWDYLGARGFSESSVYMYLYGSYTQSNGDVYVFAKEYGYPTVYKYSEQVGQWQKLLAPADLIAYDGSIVVDQNGVIYIAYALIGDQQNDYDDMLKVKKYENNQWSDVGNIGRAGCIPKLAIDSQNRLLLGFKDYGENNRFFVYRFENNDWERLGADISSGTWAKLAVDSNDTPYVSWVDSYAGYILYVSKLVGETWIKVGNAPVSEEVGCYYYQDIAIDDEGTVYAAFSAYQTNMLSVYRYNGSAWESIASEATNLSIKGMDVALDAQQNFYVAFSDMNMENRMSVMKYNGTDWNFVGQRAFSDMADTYFSMTMIHDYPCVIYTDVTNGNLATAMYYKPNEFYYPPYDLTAEVVDENNVTVAWSAPQNAEPVSYNVYRNDAKVANISETTYTDEDLIPGTYRYTVSAVYEDGESAAAGPVSVTITVSITENNEVAFVMYPNPAESFVKIESIRDAVVKIYSVNGQMLSQQVINEGVNTIDMSALNAGMYFFDIDGTMVKVVKK